VLRDRQAPGAAPVLTSDTESPLTHVAATNRIRSLIAVLLVCGFAAPVMGAAGADTARAGACKVRIILGLAQAMQPPPSDQWVRDLAAVNGVKLHYLRAITPELYLFRLTAPDADGSCSAAIARLRRDSRLRSVDLDQRRKHDAG
jgi:hypothetical protein